MEIRRFANYVRHRPKWHNIFRQSPVALHSMTRLMVDDEPLMTSDIIYGNLSTYIRTMMVDDVTFNDLSGNLYTGRCDLLIDPFIRQSAFLRQTFEWRHMFACKICDNDWGLSRSYWAQRSMQSETNNLDIIKLYNMLICQNQSIAHENLPHVGLTSYILVDFQWRIAGD